jgi:hypothetical protein
MGKLEISSNPTEVEIHDKLHVLLEQLDNAEQQAVLRVLNRVLEAFEVGSWKLIKT